MFRPLVLALMLLSSLACHHGRTSHSERDTSVEFHRSETARTANLPFSESVKAGRLLFLSGQVGTLPGTVELVGGGLVPETRQTMENIRSLLEGRGASFGDVVKCTIFLADMSRWSEFNDVYVSFFAESLPARSALGVDGLALGAEVEIECIAVLPLGDRARR